MDKIFTRILAYFSHQDRGFRIATITPSERRIGSSPNPGSGAAVGRGTGVGLGFGVGMVVGGGGVGVGVTRTRTVGALLS
jgi:hypothetical protein